MSAVDVVAQGATQDGYTLILLAEGAGKKRRFWWTCGGCWSRSEQSPDQEDSEDDANDHLAWCSVHKETRRDFSPVYYAADNAA